MTIEWIITRDDISRFKNFHSLHENSLFVKRRFETNVKRQPSPSYSPDRFWMAIVNCLLTTQQRSGPNSPITNFLSTKPFPLDLKTCLTSKKLPSLASTTLKSYGGIRRDTVIGKEISANLDWLEHNDGWSQVKEMFSSLVTTRTVENERKSADFVRQNLSGFGSKQSRNLLQMLGLTMYEIPIDSRITKWLNDFGFPLTLSAAGLADPNYYNFVMTGFQKVCEAAEIYPCQMDAAIFSRDEDWTDEKLEW